MGFFDFLREKKAEEKKIVNLSEVPKLVEQKKLELERVKSEAEAKAREMLKDLFSRFNENIRTLENASIREKEEARIKLLVKENLQAYITQLTKLVSIIKELTNEQEVISKIPGIFETFEKSSRNNYEKATILVGKELGEVRLTIKSFIQSFNELLSKNRDNFRKLEEIRVLERTIAGREENNDALTGLKDEIREIEKQLERHKEKKKYQEKELEKWKNSEEFKKESEEKEKREEERDDIKIEFSRLKEEINLKELIKTHYKDEKRLRLLRRYQENFSQALLEDKNLELGKIAGNEGKLGELQERERGLEGEPSSRLAEFEERVKKADEDISEIEKSLEKAKKRKEKIDSRKSEIDSEIKEAALRILDNIKIC